MGLKHIDNYKSEEYRNSNLYLKEEGDKYWLVFTKDNKKLGKYFILGGLKKEEVWPRDSGNLKMFWKVYNMFSKRGVLYLADNRKSIQKHLNLFSDKKIEGKKHHSVEDCLRLTEKICDVSFYVKPEYVGDYKYNGRTVKSVLEILKNNIKHRVEEVLSKTEEKLVDTYADFI